MKNKPRHPLYPQNVASAFLALHLQMAADLNIGTPESKKLTAMIARLSGGQDPRRVTEAWFGAVVSQPDWRAQAVVCWLCPDPVTRAFFFDNLTQKLGGGEDGREKMQALLREVRAEAEEFAK